jgi:hypothetical protein
MFQSVFVMLESSSSRTLIEIDIYFHLLIGCLKQMPKGLRCRLYSFLKSFSGHKKGRDSVNIRPVGVNRNCILSVLRSILYWLPQRAFVNCNGLSQKNRPLDLVRNSGGTEGRWVDQQVVSRLPAAPLNSPYLKSIDISSILETHLISSISSSLRF